MALERGEVLRSQLQARVEVCSAPIQRAAAPKEPARRHEGERPVDERSLLVLKPNFLQASLLEANRQLQVMEIASMASEEVFSMEAFWRRSHLVSRCCSALNVTDSDIAMRKRSDDSRPRPGLRSGPRGRGLILRGGNRAGSRDFERGGSAVAADGGGWRRGAYETREATAVLQAAVSRDGCATLKGIKSMKRDLKSNPKSMANHYKNNI